MLRGRNIHSILTDFVNKWGGPDRRLLTIDANHMMWRGGNCDVLFQLCVRSYVGIAFIVRALRRPVSSESDKFPSYDGAQKLCCTSCFGIECVRAK